MKTDIQVGHAKIEDLAYWINERHSIYCRRQAGQPRPWTEDPILNEWKFTNAFRQLDRGTEALRVMLSEEPPADVAAWTIMWYRLFNWHEHATELGLAYNPEQLAKYIRNRYRSGKQIFTGAHMTSGRPYEDKHESYIDSCKEAFERRHDVVRVCQSSNSMEIVHKILLGFPLVGGFISYEMVCDFRFYPGLLYDATDTLTWANMGPGAQRGLLRLGMPCETQTQGCSSMKILWRELTEHHLTDEVLQCEWPFELREVEHSLCEFDKYQRVKTGAGRPRSRYKPS